MKEEESKRRIRDFIGTQVCLIVEPSASFSTSLQSLLSGLGVPLSQIKVCKRFEDARQVMLADKPKLLVTEYDLNPGLGLTLVELQESQHTSNDRIAIIVTKNSSDTSVAEAAEGSVDAFILKPFSTDSFREKLIATFERKLNPTPYQKLLADAQQLISNNKFAEAKPLLVSAKSLDPKPAMACFLMGQCCKGLKDFQPALEQFREGRHHQDLHYKCLVGEFETLIELKKFREAYQLVPAIRSNYPVTLQRLAQFFTAAVLAYQFEGLADLYQLYTKMETRAPWATDMISVALFTGAKHWLKKTDSVQAMSFFNMALIVRGRELSFIERIINELLKANALAQSEEILSKVLPNDMGTTLHLQLQFRIDQRRFPANEMMDKGRKLIMEGHGNRDMYFFVVEQLIQAKKMTLAETIIHRASKEVPEIQAQLYALFPKSS